MPEIKAAYHVRYYCARAWELFDAWDALVNEGANAHIINVAWLAFQEHRDNCEECK